MRKRWHRKGNVIHIAAVRSGPWSGVDAYLPGGRRSGMPRRSLVRAVVLGAVIIGAAVAVAWREWPAQSDEASKPIYDVHWNEVQAPPKRVLSAEDSAWEKRGAIETSATPAPMPVQVVRGSGEQPTRATADAAIYVFDGDTFSIGNRKIRIAGIDAPETHPSRCADEARLGAAATAKLQRLLSSGTITMSGTGHDQYGRELRNISAGGIDVGDAMIGAGLARPFGSGRKAWC